MTTRVLAARPRCHVCGTPVERFLEEEGAFGHLRFIAYCHGEREAVNLRPEEARGLNFGEAFREPRRLLA